MKPARIGFFSTLIILLVSFVYFFYQKYHNAKLSSRENDLLLHLRNAELDITQRHLLSACRYDNTVLGDSIKCLSPNGVSFYLRDSLDSQTLIYKYSLSDCSSCVTQQLEFIDQLRMNKKIRAICLFQYNSLREYQAIKQSLTMNQIVLGIPYFPIEEQVYFIVDKDRAGHCFFVPDRDNVVLTRQYLDLVSERLLSE